jgi:hypothetical protein
VIATLFFQRKTAIFFAENVPKSPKNVTITLIPGAPGKAAPREAGRDPAPAGAAAAAGEGAPGEAEGGAEDLEGAGAVDFVTSLFFGQKVFGQKVFGQKVFGQKVFGQKVCGGF